MAVKYRQLEWKYRRKKNKNKKTNYNTYSFTCKEWFIYLTQSILEIFVLGYFFYHSWKLTLCLSPLLYYLLKRKKEELIDKRKKELSTQFNDFLSSINGSLQAGYSLENAVEEAYKELIAFYHNKSWMVKELGVIRNGMNNRQPVEELIHEFAERSGIEDIHDFANVIMIAKKSGGDMNEIIESNIAVIEEKLEIRQEIETSLSSRNLEVRIMSVIPFFIILYIDVTSRGYFDMLYQTIGGRIFMTVCLGVYLAAIRVSEKIIHIEI